MDGKTNGWMDRGTYGLMDKSTDEQMYGRTDRWIHSEFNFNLFCLIWGKERGGGYPLVTLESLENRGMFFSYEN